MVDVYDAAASAADNVRGGRSFSAHSVSISVPEESPSLRKRDSIRAIDVSERVDSHSDSGRSAAPAERHAAASAAVSQANAQSESEFSAEAWLRRALEKAEAYDLKRSGPTAFSTSRYQELLSRLPKVSASPDSDFETAFLQSPSSDGPVVRAFIQFRGNDASEKKGLHPRRPNFVKVHPAVSAMLKDVVRTSFMARIPHAFKFPPMIVPPNPWTRHDCGAYLVPDFSSRLTQVMRSYDHRQRKAIADQQTKDPSKLQRVFEALNVLGQTPWKINRRILDIMLTMWRDDSVCGRGEPFLDIPPDRSFMPQPVEGSQGPVLHIPPLVFSLVRTKGGLGLQVASLPSRRALALSRAARQRSRKLCSEAEGLRRDFGYKVAVAQAHRDEAAIYFPHSLDFRGRAYPMHPHLNHMGGDVPRGLLSFGTGRQLGPHGLFWQRVQLANLYGNGEDKKTLEQREAFAVTHLTEILQACESPLAEAVGPGGTRGTTWWMQAEKPWQFLAACYELRDALSWEREHGSVETFVSFQPVHTDGSCNGLQHYAALARDLEGGKAVNLLPSDAPSDVYSEIAAKVAKQV